MTAPAIHLAFDGGWSDGDPGDGRLRFDSPTLHKARHLYVNARDAQEVLLGHLVPTWKPGDVLVIERPGAEKNRVVCWIIGPVTHGGSYYKLPILVRTLAGGFASHDEVSLHHYASLPEGVTEPPAWSPPPRPQQQPAQPAAPEANAMAPVAMPSPSMPEPEAVAPIETAPVAPVAAEPAIENVVQQIIREVPDPAIAERLGALEQRVTDAEDRLAAAERHLLHPPVAPVADDWSPPSFMRGAPSVAPEAAPAVQISPAREIAMDDVLRRLDDVEQAITRFSRELGDVQSMRDQQSSGPSYRLVEAAHLARNGQELPLKLMSTIGEAIGVDWEAAALRIIREHDKATEADALAYARAAAAIGG